MDPEPPAQDRWKGPPLGNDLYSPLLHLALRADFRGAHKSHSNVPEFLAFVADLLGDHRAEFYTSFLAPRAWATDLPWRQKYHGAALTMPLSTFAEPRTWRLVLDLADGQYWQISARRGGGAKRHVVWTMGQEWRRFGSIDGLDFLLSARHISDRSRVHDLAAAFFAAVAADGAIGGCGEVVQTDSPEFMNWYPTDDCSGRSLLDLLQLEEYNRQGPRLAAPRLMTLLTTPQLERLGGLDSLVARAKSAGLRICCEKPPYCTIGMRHPEIVFGALPAGAWLAVKDLQTLSFSLAHGGGPDCPSSMLWLFDELRQADLLVATGPPLFPAHRDLECRRLAEYERHSSVRPRSESRKDDQASRLAYLRSHPPRCVRTRAVLETKPPAGLSAEAICFRLDPQALSKALTIYGRATRGEGMLGSPVLVGSLEVDRAALYFDSRIHGFDGENSPPAPEKARPIGRLKQLVCPKCGGRLFHVWAAFEPDDEGQGTPVSGRPRPEDLFTWFWLHAKCAACRWRDTVTDVECA